jgi:hypothetical protein
LGSQPRSKSVAEIVAADKTVHPTSDVPISGQCTKLPDVSETGRSVVDVTQQGQVSDTHAVTYVKDVSENRGVLESTASESIEVTYTAEQVSHHPPGMLV